ncbi:MAG: hypothetical protein RL254_1046 [Planctomycetota bacterium]
MDIITQGNRGWWRSAPCLLAVLFACAVLPVIMFGSDATSEASDEAAAHLPTVLQFAAQLPTPDLHDYPSATGPGYHLLMAVPARLGVGVHGLRIIASLAGLALVLLVWRTAARAAGPAVALALTLPLLVSTYVLSGSAWLTTDVLSVLIGTTMVAIAAWWMPTMRTFLTLAVLFVAALSVRQTNVFLAAPILAAGILGSPLGRSASDAEQWSGDEPRSWSRLAAACLALVPAALLLLALVNLWGGLMPATFRSLHDKGLSPVAPAYGLALLGTWAAIALLPMAPEVLHTVRRHALAITLVASLAFLGAVVADSTWSVEQGRWGGAYWMIVKAFPAIGGRSMVIVAAAVVGAVLAAVLWIRAAEIRRGRQATIVLVSLLALMVVQAGNSQVWQRYFDPAILVALAWLISLGINRTRPHSAGRAVLGALLLAGVQATISTLDYWMPVFR